MRTRRSQSVANGGELYDPEHAEAPQAALTATFALMKGNYRLTPLGAGLIVLLGAGIVAMVVGSRALQAVGFVLVVLIICLGAMAFLSGAGGSFTVVWRGGSGGPSRLPGGRGIRAASLFDTEQDFIPKAGEPGAQSQQDAELDRGR